MSRRFSAALFTGLSLIVASITLGSAAGMAANDSPIDPPTTPIARCGAVNAGIWSENCDGWRFTVNVAADVVLKPTVSLPKRWFELKTYPESIDSKTPGSFVGRSTPGGPANIDFTLASTGSSEAPQNRDRFIEINSTISGRTTIRCGVRPPGNSGIHVPDIDDLGCTVPDSQEVRDEKAGRIYHVLNDPKSNTISINFRKINAH